MNISKCLFDIKTVLVSGFSPSFTPLAAFIFFCVLNLYTLLFALSKFSWLLNVQPSWQFKQLLIKNDEVSLIKADAGYLWLHVASAGQCTVVFSSAVMLWYYGMLHFALWFSSFHAVRLKDSCVTASTMCLLLFLIKQDLLLCNKAYIVTNLDCYQYLKYYIWYQWILQYY